MAEYESKHSLDPISTYLGEVLVFRKTQKRWVKVNQALGVWAESDAWDDYGTFSNPVSREHFMYNSQMVELIRAGEVYPWECPPYRKAIMDDYFAKHFVKHGV
jgi:hypothetical protein